MNNHKLAATGMVAVSCLFLIASVADISVCYIRNGHIAVLKNAGILVAIEFVSKKITVSFSKESSRLFFFPGSDRWQDDHTSTEVCYTGVNLHNSMKRQKKWISRRAKITISGYGNGMEHEKYSTSGLAVHPPVLFQLLPVVSRTPWHVQQLHQGNVWTRYAWHFTRHSQA